MRRTSLSRSSSRTAHKVPWGHPSTPEPRVDLGALRLRVFQRDGWTCLAASLDPEHRCGGAFGKAVLGTDYYRQALTLEHVRTDPGGARRDREEFCVTLCYEANSYTVWGSANRALLNDYLDRLYPDRRSTI